MQLVVNTENLRKTYNEGLLKKRGVEALRGVSLQIHAGEVFGLLGPNGAGKTTLIKILLGIVRKTSGSASVLDHPIGSQASRARIGYLPENLHIARHHTARTALRYYGALGRLDAKTINRRSDELLELVGLKDRSNESVRRFSKGMGQRLGLAQALLNNPDLLILDEPTDGLDPVGRSQVRDIIDELKKQGKTIFVNSHILQEVEMICDRVAILAGGEVRGVGTIDSLRGSGTASTRIMTSELNAETMQVLSEKYNAQIGTHDNESVVITLPSNQQNTIDGVIDIVRAADASVYRLTHEQSTLEDVFMSLVES